VAAQTAGVVFDRSVYQVAPGETFDIQVLLDGDLSTPEADALASGLFSYSWQMTFESANASVDTILVPPELDYFAFLDGASIKTFADVAAVEGNINQVTLEPYEGSLLATISLTNLAPVPTEYDLTLSLAPHLPKEQLFLDGEGNVLDDDLFFGAARVVVAIPEPGTVTLALVSACAAGFVCWRKRR
jgi:hypothetical protein